LQSYKELIVWGKAVELVADVFHATASFPRDEVYGSTNQLRRSAPYRYQAISLKGRGVQQKASSFSFYATREGLCPVGNAVDYRRQLGYLSSDENNALLNKATEVARILNGLLISLGISSRKRSTIH